MKDQTKEILRYVVNGIIATVVHYSILTLNLTVLAFPSAGLANLVAALFGITVSFLGSRYFVFQKTEHSIFSQALKFSSLYGVIAVLHGAVLFLWTDRLSLDYRIGFLIATVMQVSISYLGNKRLVFNV